MLNVINEKHSFGSPARANFAKNLLTDSSYGTSGADGMFG